MSRLVVLESTDSLKWDTLAKIGPLPTMAAKGKRSFPVKSLSTHLRFKYIKSAGNLAFDDFRLTTKNTTAIELYSDQLIYSVYPNPSVDGHFTLQLGSLQSSRIISVSNSIGEVVKTIATAAQEKNVEISGLTAGIYFVNVIQGNVSTTKKIVVCY